ncbi:VRR-NUC domain-containing protein [Marisediminicola senii]|uniref:VRR-NUC domain-containing protein n=1 Tax=Marisediminicola senii TaxID=2711233 RepID=UPI001F2B0BFA|nr:VRR-NUC domain-containing protein [Marisediminicola senii]
MTAQGITLDEYHAMQARNMTEDQLQRVVIAMAERLGFLVYHTHDSRRSQPGFPDLVLVHPARGMCLYRELKKQNGATRPDQKKWLAALTAAGQDAAIWRPSDWFSNAIDAELLP